MSRRTSSSVRTSRGLKLAVADRRTGAARNCALDHPTKISKRSRHNFNECIGIAAYSRCFVPVARNFGNDESMAFKSSSCRCLLFIQIFVGNVVLRHLMRSNFSLIRVCGFYSTNHSGFERIAFLEQLGDAFRIRTLEPG